MNNILQDTSPASLTTAIEENMVALIVGFGKWPRAEVHNEPNIAWSITDIPFPLFNNIVRTQLEPESIKPAIQARLAEAKARNVPLLWRTGPTTRPADLSRYLEEHGFVDGGQSAGMAVDLAQLNEQAPMPAGLRIQRITGTELLKQWGQVGSQGFGLPDFVGKALSELMRYVDPETMLAYLGWQNDQPVATSLLALAAGVAGIYNVATVPDARRQGIGAVMTLQPLREARERGYQVGILHASKMGEGVYRSLGFREYCQIGHYVWLPEDKSDVG